MEVCPKCKGNGWLCEKHPGLHWPHAATRTECLAEGIPCDCPAGAYVLPHRVIWLKLERATHLTVKLGEESRRFSHGIPTSVGLVRHGREFSGDAHHF
jgi:hypothetical protein